jgi:hypothetical protein
MLCWMQVCSPFYNRAMGLSKTRYYALRKRVEAGTLGRSSSLLRIKRKSPNSERKTAMRHFLDGMFKTFGQYIPNKDEMHMPVGFTKLGMYESYKRNVGAAEAMEQSTFGRCWTAYFPRVKIVPSSDFAKCNRCILAKETLDALATSTALRGMGNCCNALQTLNNKRSAEFGACSRTTRGQHSKRARLLVQLAITTI